MMKAMRYMSMIKSEESKAAWKSHLCVILLSLNKNVEAEEYIKDAMKGFFQRSSAVYRPSELTTSVQERRGFDTRCHFRPCSQGSAAPCGRSLP